MRRKQTIFILFLTFIFISALFLRFYNLDRIPYSLDERTCVIFRYEESITSFKNFFWIPPESLWASHANYNYTKQAVHLNYGMQSATTPFGWQLLHLSALILGKTPFGLRFIFPLFGMLYLFVFFFILHRFYERRKTILGIFLLTFFPFAIYNTRNDAILEPIALFFFLTSLYFFMLYPGKKGRILWIVFSTFMVFSNFPKAIILLAVFFLWEALLLFIEKRSIRSIFIILPFYIIPFLPSFFWFIGRAFIFDLPFLWFLQHPFARSAVVPFRIIEIFYAYGSLKQAALLIIPAFIGILIMIIHAHTSTWKLSTPAKKLDLLWILLVIVLLPLMILVRQSGPHNHSLLVPSLVILSTHTLCFCYDALKKKHLSKVIIIFTTILSYITLTSFMGQQILAVPKQDAAAFTLYTSTILTLFHTPLFLFFFFSILIGSLILFIIWKTHSIRDSLLQKILSLIFLFMLILYAFHAFFLILSGSI